MHTNQRTLFIKPSRAVVGDIKLDPVLIGTNKLKELKHQ